MASTALLIGGTGQVGRAVADLLLADGWSVTLAHWGALDIPPALIERGARGVRFDRDCSPLAPILGNGADALIDMVAYDACHAEQLATVQGSVGALVVLSSISVYCDAEGRTLDEATSPDTFPVFPVPATEGQRIVPPGLATYSTRKVALEHTLLDRIRCPLSILRPGAIHGVGSRHPREWWFVKRMLDNRRRIPLAYDGRLGLHSSAAVNIASLIGTVLSKTTTQILNAVDPDPPSVRQIGELLAARLGRDVNLVGLPMEHSCTDVGATPWSTPAAFVASDASARALGYQPVARYQDAVGPLCDWLVAQADQGDWRGLYPVMASYTSDPFDYLAEDRLLDELTVSQSGVEA